MEVKIKLPYYQICQGSHHLSYYCGFWSCVCEGHIDTTHSVVFFSVSDV